LGDDAQGLASAFLDEKYIEINGSSVLQVQTVQLAKWCVGILFQRVSKLADSEMWGRFLGFLPIWELRGDDVFTQGTALRELSGS